MNTETAATPQAAGETGTITGAVLARAVGFAFEAHRTQTRKGSRVPYMAHPLRVAALVAACGGTQAQVIAAMLHDVAEDQGGVAMLAEIAQRFGDEVAGMVEACSDALPDRDEAKPAWRPRKLAYIAGLADAPAGPESLVEIADKVANLRDILDDIAEHGEATLDRFTGGRSGTLWYYRQVVDILAPRVPELGKYSQTLVTRLEALTSDLGYQVVADYPGSHRIIGAWPADGVLHLAGNEWALPFPVVQDVDIIDPGKLLGWLLQERGLLDLDVLTAWCVTAGLSVPFPAAEIAETSELQAAWAELQGDGSGEQLPIVQPFDATLQAAIVLGVETPDGPFAVLLEWREVALTLLAEVFADPAWEDARGGRSRLAHLIDRCDSLGIGWQLRRRGLLPTLRVPAMRAASTDPCYPEQVEQAAVAGVELLVAPHPQWSDGLTVALADWLDVLAAVLEAGGTPEQLVTAARRPIGAAAWRSVMERAERDPEGALADDSPHHELDGWLPPPSIAQGDQWTIDTEDRIAQLADSLATGTGLIGACTLLAEAQATAMRHGDREAEAPSGTPDGEPGTRSLQRAVVNRIARWVKRLTSPSDEASLPWPHREVLTLLGQYEPQVAGRYERAVAEFDPKVRAALLKRDGPPAKLGDPVGCDTCIRLSPRGSMHRDPAERDVASLFTVASSDTRDIAFLSARLVTCGDCGTVWMRGYYEDWTDAELGDEFGDRHLIWRPLTPQHVRLLNARAQQGASIAEGRSRFDIDTFGA